ncbi:MAG: hypothetical protein HXX80_04270, partial [Nitrososphaerales archaeon]|nr:hypothetical protein [Nitrososphaerales archaeon]
TRSFIRNLSFRFTDKVTVFVKAPSGWREWYAQRKRWSIGAALWLKDHYAHLVRIIIKKPQVVLPSLLLVLPSLLLLSLIYLLPDTVYYHLIAFALTVLATFTSLALPPIFLTSFGIPIFKNLIAALLTFTIFSGVYYPLVRKMGSSFNPIEFLLFYFFYSPIVLLMTFIGLLKVVIHGERVRTDWKV